MSNTTQIGLQVRTGIKAGFSSQGVPAHIRNHSKSQAGLQVRTGVKAGGKEFLRFKFDTVFSTNHAKTQAGVPVRTGVKAGTVVLPWIAQSRG